MSRQFDAKQEALKVYPTDRESGVDLFLTILNVSEEDFRYEEGMSTEDYVYGPPGEAEKAMEPFAWLGEADGFKSFTRKKSVADMWATGNIKVTPVAALSAEGERDTFQARVQPWMMACFGPESSADKLERSDRFIEEALELVQAGDYPKERALALVDYVYGRDQGEINQEAGGVMVTLAAHCLAHGIDMHEAGETELARIWTKIEKIRAKQAAKPTGSALPIAQDAPKDDGE
jgi:NTP pyrophosphatase (non-canonical NTP hydrolase)